MNFPEEAPKLNPLPFIIVDIVLLVAALLIVHKSPAPLDALPLIAITTCVCLGAVLACIPIVLNYTRRRDALLDERQDQLVAITQTAAAAANQLSIAASNLHNIAETTAKMLRHVEALPARLQEKIGEFKTQLNEVNIAENEALEQEINTLRASETERLETALEKIKQFAAEIIARETGAKKQSDDTALKLAAIVRELDAAIKAVSTQIPLIIEDARRDLGQSIGKSLEHQNKEVLARLTEELAAIENGIKERHSKWLAEQSARQAPVTPPPALPSPVSPPVPPSPLVEQSPPPPPSPPPLSAESSPPPAVITPAEPLSPPPAPKPSPSLSPSHALSPKPKAATKTEVPPTPPPTPPQSQPQLQSQPQPQPPLESPKTAKSEHPEQPEQPAEPPPPQSPPPPSSSSSPPPSASSPPSPSPPLPPPPAPPPPKKRTPKTKPPRDDKEPVLGLDLPSPSDEYSQSEPEDGGFTTAMSADGVTRLIATAYIGIGNKLFIRGDGPGLGWDKGVPLQFVSIGKWRWETNDASAPVSFKLYKNDNIECTRIGSPKLEPGHQHEVTANF